MENTIKQPKNLIEIDIDKAKSQKIKNIEGIEIYFPFIPYPAQIDYMKKVILTLKNRGNISALESPTGTGKTLCLLCSVLGWKKYIQDIEEENINIYYCTRTVSQIKNVMKELQKTCYIIKTSFLTSRKFSCVKFSKAERYESDISKLNDLCESYRKDNYCEYYKTLKNSKIPQYDNLEDTEEIENIKSLEDIESIKHIKDIDDIEDLFVAGKKYKFCPYFYNLKKTESIAIITFMSYNYILNPIIRKRLKKVIHENSIIILDEAHNICNVFENLY